MSARSPRLSPILLLLALLRIGAAHAAAPGAPDARLDRIVSEALRDQQIPAVTVAVMVADRLVRAILGEMQQPLPADQPAASDGVFRVTPVRPVAELLPAALAATPPAESGDFRPADLVELTSLDPAIRLDIRYATTRNFLGTPLYSEARAFLQRPAAEALVRVQRSLAAEGYGLLVHDAYRPWYVTKIFWDATPPGLHRFVADPAEGSRHNRGCAVDLTLYDLRSGQEVEMPSLYDETTERAYPTYNGGTAVQRRMRDLLRRHMEAEGFAVYEFEWWHFDYRDWKSYRIGNARFEDLGVKH